MPTTQDNFDDWLDDTKQFCHEIIAHGCDNPDLIDCQISMQKQSINLTTKIPVKHTTQGVQCVFYRSSSAKAKDLFTLYLHQLIVQQWQQQNIDTDNYNNNPLSQVQSTCGFYFNTKAQKVEQYIVANINDAEAELNKLFEVYEQGQKQALLLNGDLAAQVFKQSRGKDVELTQERFELFWYGADSTRGFAEDPYIHYFWQQCPDIFTYIPQLKLVYQSLYQHVKKESSKAKGERT